MHPSRLSQSQSSPLKSSYAKSPASQRRRKTPSATHSWKRSWAVEPGQKRVALSAFHWQPVRRTNRMASMHTRSSLRGRPPPKRWVLRCSGSNSCMACQRSSGICHGSTTAISRAETGCMMLLPCFRRANVTLASQRYYTQKQVIRIGSKLHTFQHQSHKLPADGENDQSAGPWKGIAACRDTGNATAAGECARCRAESASSHRFCRDIGLFSPGHSRQHYRALQEVHGDDARSLGSSPGFCKTACVI
jgi:hypothetical protein